VALRADEGKQPSSTHVVVSLIRKKDVERLISAGRVEQIKGRVRSLGVTSRHLGPSGEALHSITSRRFLPCVYYPIAYSLFILHDMKSLPNPFCVS
jgi:hypothetical protein